MDAEKAYSEVPAAHRSMNRCWSAGWQKEKYRQDVHPDAVAIVPSETSWHGGLEAYARGLTFLSLRRILPV